MNRSFLLLTLVVMGFASLPAQDIITKAAAEGCECLKSINADDFTEKQLPFKILGCLSTYSDEVKAELRKQGTYKDEPFEAVTAVRNEAYKNCPDEFDRLNKKKEKVEVDPKLLAIDENSDLIKGFGDAICRCVEITKEKNWDECMERVFNANEESLEERLTAHYKDIDNMFKAMTILGLDLGMTLMDNCAALENDETFTALKVYPAVTSGCNKLVVGEYVTETILGDVKAVITANRYSEYKDGKLTEDYKLTWNGCTATLVAQKPVELGGLKKGDAIKMEIKRASDRGFLSVIYYKTVPAPHLFVKTK
ncbi:MAG TPA: hypothetical protein PLV21_01200 [Cyclobacteriaceae bacterium]|nr:hypothetical protein [Cyclobacteriaceae bacterium]HRJ80471.1 hypothetical protein [Cyclobacteriaceae bacterium]